jgi:hypothetical protein
MPEICLWGRAEPLSITITVCFPLPVFAAACMLATPALARQHRNQGDPGSWRPDCRRESPGLTPLQPLLGITA